MRTLDSFPEDIRRMTREELESAVFADTNRRRSWDAAAWLAKTRELGGADSQLGKDRQEALELLCETLPHCEYQAVVGILLDLPPRTL